MHNINTSLDKSANKHPINYQNSYKGITDHRKLIFRVK